MDSSLKIINKLFINIFRFFFLLQEWHSTEEELVPGWGLRHDMPDPSWQELHLHHASEGPDRELLLLPVPRLPQGCRGIRWHPDPQQAQNPCPIPGPRRGLHGPHWRLVQGQPHGKTGHRSMYVPVLTHRAYKHGIGVATLDTGG